MKKKIGLLLLIVMLSMVFVSCGSEPWEGVWKISDGYGKLNLLSNGTFVSNDFFKNEKDNQGSYIVNGNTITFNSPAFNNQKYTYEVSKATEFKLFKDGNEVYSAVRSESRSGYFKIAIGVMLGFTINLIKDYALAIIVFTIILKLVLLPLSIKQTKSTIQMNKVQPIVAKINEKYKNDKQMAQQKTMELYKKAKINPLAGCLPMIVNMVLLIAFFRVLLYPDVFIYHKGVAVDHQLLTGSFLWVENLSKPDLLVNIPIFKSIIPENWQMMVPGIMPIVTALVTLFSFNAMTGGAPSNPQSTAMMTSMKYFMPLMFLFLGAKYPASLMLYWTVSSVFQMIQQPLIKKMVEKKEEA